MRLLAAVLLLFALLPALPLRAQEAATLVADTIYLNADTRLVAEGGVEVFYRGARLRAARIVYDRATERVSIEGPITMTEADGGTVILADAAELSPDLSEGILTGARMVMQQQLQIAATEMLRASGRYTQLTQAVASSCQVCPSNPTPLWEIRARRILHDQEERQLYFDRAQFRVMGLPVMFFPRLRMPDPTVDRATGFLIPAIRTTSQLGTGFKLPYFITIGDSRDLTLTPYLSTTRTATLELRYREAFATGRIEFNGAVSHDDIQPDDTRGYLFGTGTFALPRDFRLDLDLRLVSDRAYLLDYDISNDDRLQSDVEITRTRRNEFILGRLAGVRSIRTGEDNDVLPTFLGDLTYHRRFSPRWLGGEGGFRFDLHGHRRASSVDTDANGDGITDGRDLARASARIDWRRNWTFGPGLVVSGMVEATADLYAISQDASFPGTVTRITPAAAVELRWPWVKTGRAGASYLVEPVVQLVWAPDDTGGTPNEDSRIVEFDEGNLFALNRFPGADAHEAGARANIGLNWTRHDPAGWSLGLAAGRVFRARDLGQFTAGTGLDGISSDWLVAAQLVTADGLAVTNRALFDDGLTFTLNETRIDWQAGRYGLNGSYIWMESDPAQDRPQDVHELALGGHIDVATGWRASFDGRYDFVTNRTARAGVGLQYRNECATVDLSLSRRFTSSTSVDPVTDFGLQVELAGFGTGSDGRPRRRSCLR